MIMTKTMLFIGALVYVFLWVLYANGDSVLLAPLLIPAVVAVMVAFMMRVVDVRKELVK